MNGPTLTAGIDAVNAVEVQERLDWQAMRAGQAATVTIDTATLSFLPNGPHQVAAMANLGAELLQEIQAYRPQFLFKSSPAEIVGALIEETAAPPTAAAPVQPMPDGWCQFIDGVKTQNVVRNEKELSDLKEMMQVLGRPGVVEYRPFYFAPPSAPNAAATFARQLIDSGAENYIGQAFDTECGDIEVTARYTLGKTPAEKLADLEANITAAQADTKDAERYRWLTEVQGLRYSPSGGQAIVDIGEMNAAIDAAISAQNAAKS
jgi:hypothetical protein